MYTRARFSFRRFYSKLWKASILVTLYSSAIYYIFTLDHGINIEIPLSITTVLGTAISLLLGFRTNAAYNRWWEARKIWGAIVNDSRSVVRQVNGFIDPNFTRKEELVREIAFLQIAWCYALTYSLRKLPLPDEVKKYLGEENYEKTNNHSNVPNAILKLMNEKIATVFQSKFIEAYHFGIIEKTIQNLCDDMGMSERIKNTVFPLQYSYFTKLSLFIYFLFLPFGMMDEVGVWIIPITLIVILFFSLMEVIADYLQDPFENRNSDTPMSTLCRTIEINLLQMVEEKETPEPLKPDGHGVLM